MRKIDFDGIRRAALASLDLLLDEWLPGGKRITGNWVACNPVRDEKNPSFSVSLSTGAFNDYADPSVKGGDLIALCAYLWHNDDQKAAAEELAQRFGLPLHVGGDVLSGDAPKRAGRAAVEKPSEEDKARTDWVPVMPVPADAPEPPAAHVVRGKPELTWCYRDGDGQVLGYIYRFKRSGGGKEVMPLVWARHQVSGAHEWHWLSFPQPRPLYGLDDLAARPDATVLVVEGEKCKDAAQAQLPDLVVVSWPGGGKAVKRADWSPLVGRKVVLWPDCDALHERLTAEEREAGVAKESKPLLPVDAQPGIVAMRTAAEILGGLGCKLWMMEIPAPGEKPDGWDVADAVDEGITGSALSDYVRAQARALAPADEGEEADSEESESAPDPDPAGAGRGYGENDAWRVQLLRKESGGLIDCRENVYLMLANHPAWQGVIQINEFSRRVEKRTLPPWPNAMKGEWDDNDTLRLGMWLADSERLIVKSVDNLSMAVKWIASERCFHPVREYLDGLQWDGVVRLDDWLTDCLGVRKNEYAMLSGRLFLIGMVARIYRPGCRMRNMPILEGEQYRGKSTALQILAGEWFGDTPLDLRSKDSYQMIQGVWLYEFGELDSFNKADSTLMKTWVASPSDKFRAPYDRAPKDWPRQCVFSGTTNHDEYFKDPTGNTRYWPWRCMEEGDIDHERLSAMRDQLFAEAVVCFERGDRWHPTGEEQRRLFDPVQEDRMLLDAWEPLIYRWLRKQVRPRVTMDELLFECLKIEPAKLSGTKQEVTRIGAIMARLHWTKKRETSGGRGYYYAEPDEWKAAPSAAGSRGEGEDEPF